MNYVINFGCFNSLGLVLIEVILYIGIKIVFEINIEIWVK